MSEVFKLHIVGSPVLRKTLPLVDINEETLPRLQQISEMMVNTMKEAHGIGLAGNQVGFFGRLFIMYEGEKVIKIANPEVTETDGEQKLEEGCLSCPGLVVPTKRAKHITIKGINIDDGRECLVDGTDLEAAIIQHELDHLNGRMILDQLSSLKRDIYKRKVRKLIKKHSRHGHN